jgi:predicted Zn finger-like uncharacterized protein
MIIQCQSCSSKYFLPEEKVPVNPLKVRCPKCRAVFMLSGRAERAPVAAPAPARAVETAIPTLETARIARKFTGREHELPGTAVATEPVPVEMPMASQPAPLMATIENAAMAAPAETVEAPRVEPAVVATPEPVVPEPVRTAPEVAAAPAPAPEPAVTPAPAAKSAARGGKSADDRARRLARVLVSDILWYNRERRDAALRDGTLMTSLGEEIKKSWELYKEKVGPEAAHSTNYFKEALNEILANGQQVF